MPGPGQSLSVTLSRCSLRPSLAAIRAASCDLLALLPGLRIHATVIAHGISDWISTGSLRQCFNILPRALSGSRAALCALRSTVPAHAGCPHTMDPLCCASHLHDYRFREPRRYVTSSYVRRIRGNFFWAWYKMKVKHTD